MVILKSIIFLLFLILASTGWGKISFGLIRTRFPKENLPYIVYPALGLGIISYLSLTAGLAGFFNPLTLSLIYLLGFLVSITTVGFYLKKVAVAFKGLGNSSVSHKWFLALLLLAIAIIFIKTLNPPANINDSLAYHLNCPKVFLKNSRVFAIPYDVDCTMPFFMEMLFAFGIALKQPIFAKLISYLMGVLLVLAIYDFSKRYVSQKYSILASLVFILTPVVYVHMSYAYVELGLAFYIFISFYMFYEWLRRKDSLFLVLSGIFMGFALSVKVLAGFLFFGFCLYIILRGIIRRQGLVHLGKTLLLYGFFSFIFSFVWYLRSYLIFGNPVFPYLNTFFGGESLGLVGELSHHGLGRGTDFFSFLRLPWDLTFYPNIFGGDRLNPIYLGVLPLVLIAVRSRELQRLCFFIMAYLIFWFFSCQRARFLIPVLPFGSVVVCFLVSRVQTKPWKIIKVTLFCFISVFLFLETAALIYNTRDRFAVAWGMENKYDYLMREERTYPIARYINNNLPINVKILATEVRLFYFDRNIVREDIFRLFTGYDKKGFSKNELLKLLNKKGFTHILCNKPPSSYNLPLYHLLEEDTTLLHTEGGYYLYRIN